VAQKQRERARHAQILRAGRIIHTGAGTFSTLARSQSRSCAVALARPTSGPPAAASSSSALATVAALCVGSAATLIPRALLASPCPADGLPLAAPVFAALCTTLAASLGLPVELALRARRGEAAAPAAAATAAAAAAAAEPPSLRRYAALLLPGALQAAGTLLQLAALVYLRASALAGLRGAFIVLTAALSARLALRDAPRGAEEWACVGASGGGALLVGLAAELQAAAADGGGGGGGAGGGGGGGAGAQAALGLSLSLGGYAVAAAQVALEQRALDGLGLSRWEILGVEGLVGAGACAALFAALALAPPAAAVRLAAAGVDAPARVLDCLRDAPLLPALGAAYGAASFGLNALLLVLAERIGPNYRVFVFTARGLLTFLVELALFYGPLAAARPFGQAAAPLAALQLAGFALLIGGGSWRLGAQRRRQRREAAAAEEGAEDAKALLLPTSEAGSGTALEGDSDEAARAPPR